MSLAPAKSDGLLATRLTCAILFLPERVGGASPEGRVNASGELARVAAAKLDITMSAVPEIVTKAEFASLLGVSRPAVSQYISEKKISGPAIVGSGVRARINVEIARRQLNKNLDVVRHNSLSGKARTTGTLKTATVRQVPPPEAPEPPSPPPGARGPQTVSGDDLARVLGIDATAFQQAVRDGVIVRASKDRFELVRSINRYTESLRSALDAAQQPEETGVEEAIKNQRLDQLSLSNDKAREEALARSGRYVLAEDVQQEIGRTASRILTLIESTMIDFAALVSG
jgi:predicted transcriptional regulator